MAARLHTGIFRLKEEGQTWREARVRGWEALPAGGSRARPRRGSEATSTVMLPSSTSSTPGSVLCSVPASMYTTLDRA